MSKEPEATTESFPNGWHLVTYGTWQISVGPDGLLMLPRHLHPEEVADFTAAAAAASEVGRRVRADNDKLAAEQPQPQLRAGHPIISQGGVPAGSARMLVSSGPNNPPESASIGRRARPGAQPAGTQGPPVMSQPPQP